MASIMLESGNIIVVRTEDLRDQLDQLREAGDVVITVRSAS
jgi:hypothetical protein